MELPDGRKKRGKRNRERRFNWLTPVAHVVNSWLLQTLLSLEVTGPPGSPAQHQPSPGICSDAHGQNSGGGPNLQEPAERATQEGQLPLG